MNLKYLSTRTVFIFLAGIIGGMLSLEIYSKLSNTSSNNLQDNKLLNEISPIRSKSKNNLFTAPLLGYEIPESAGLPEYEPLEQKIESLIKAKLSKEEASRISVYFSDNNRGRWVGVNENMTYSPASLLKVPLMMVYYKIAQSDPSRLQNKIVYQGGENLNSMERIKPSKELTVGASYTVEELLMHMIVESDNNATALLLANIDRNTLNELFSDLNIQLPENGEPEDYLSAKSYALFFRLLYNSTYLNQQYSEQALKLLATSNFAEGLVKGVPPETKVAHKFGEFESEGRISEFHDCGNIYFNDNPYLLCIMTAGKDFNSLKNTIQDISTLVYKEINQ